MLHVVLPPTQGVKIARRHHGKLATMSSKGHEHSLVIVDTRNLKEQLRPLRTNEALHRKFLSNIYATPKLHVQLCPDLRRRGFALSVFFVFSTGWSGRRASLAGAPVPCHQSQSNLGTI